MKKAFTLIELLIVVAIIAILAAIAVPNFLEAQTRSKVSRVKSDMRTFATAIESYAVDHNKPPREFNFTFYNDVLQDPVTGNNVTGLSGLIHHVLSTPVSYITVARIKDVFQDRNLNVALDEQFYTYQDMQYRNERANGLGFWAPAYEFYGSWRMFSVGPNRDYRNLPTTNGAQKAYDPTNGTISSGNIHRSQKLSDSRQPDPGRTYTYGAGSSVLLGAN